MRPTAVFTVVALALAGCVTPSGPGEALPVDESLPAGPVPFWALGGGDCIVSATVLMVEFDAVYPYLPAGYYPEDVGRLVGAEYPVDRAGVGVANVDCNESHVGPVGFHAPLIFVQTPAIDVDLRPNMLDGLVLDWATDAPELWTQLTKWGASPRDASQSVARTLLGSDVSAELRSIALLESEWKDPDGTYWSSRVDGAAPFELPVDGFRAWTVLPEGTLAYEAVLTNAATVNDVTFSFGPTDCAMRVDHPVAQIVPEGICQQDRSFGLNVLPFDFVASEFHYHHGVFA